MNRHSPLLFLLFFLGSLSLSYAQNILIYSPTHGDQSSVYQIRGLMLIEIRSLQPMLQIKVNGKTRSFQNPYKTRLFIRYRLHPQKNNFKISVSTKNATQIHDFILNLISKKMWNMEFYQSSDSIKIKKEVVFSAPPPPPPPKKVIKKEKPEKAWSALMLLGAGYSSNLGRSEKAAASGFLTQAMLQPQFKFQWKDQNFLLKALAYREKNLVSEQGNKEITLNTFSLDWMRNIRFGSLKITGGIRDLDNEFDWLMGKTHLEKDVFLKSELAQKITKEDSILYRFAYTNKNLDTGESGSHNPDGSLWSVAGQWNTRTLGMRTQFFGNYDSYTAKGAYQNYTLLGLGVRGIRPLPSEMAVQANFQMQQTRYKNQDPVKGVQELTRLSQLNMGVTHPLLKSYGITLLAELRLMQQASNVDSFSYSEQALLASMLYKY